MTHISGFERSQILLLPEAVSIRPRRAFGGAQDDLKHYYAKPKPHAVE
jgi:hypothetical protein